MKRGREEEEDERRERRRRRKKNKIKRRMTAEEKEKEEEDDERRERRERRRRRGDFFPLVNVCPPPAQTGSHRLSGVISAMRNICPTLLNDCPGVPLEFYSP